MERLENGEVSTFLHDEVRPGDELEVRGPIGGWFVWRGSEPAFLVGGGSGVVPLMAMLRLARREGRSELLRLIVSARSPADLYYADELPGAETTVVYTRAGPPGWTRPLRRLSEQDLAGQVAEDATAYVCGSPAFADSVTRAHRRRGPDGPNPGGALRADHVEARPGGSTADVADRLEPRP